MSSPTYCQEADVYGETGLDTDIVQQFGDKTVAEVTTLINGYILDAEKFINDLMNIPEIVHHEYHKGTGETDEFDLGPFDEMGFYDDYSPENNTVRGYACWFGNIRKKVPYPVTADQTESIASTCTTSLCVASNETTIKSAGANALKMIFSGAGYCNYPSTQDLDKNIDIFDFLSFRVYCSNATINITIRLYDKDGNYNYVTFTVDKANKWYIKNFDLRNEFTGAIDWDDIPLYYWEIRVDGACILYMDNWNFNDGWFFTAPQGKLVISRKATEEPPSDGYPFYIDYTYNPMLASIPRNIKQASAKIAGISLLNFMIGRRERDTAFLAEADTLITAPDKETLYHRRSKLSSEKDELLASFGYSYEFGVVGA